MKGSINETRHSMPFNVRTVLTAQYICEFPDWEKRIEKVIEAEMKTALKEVHEKDKEVRT